MDSQAPTSRKWVLQLIGRLVALRRFISHSTYRLKSFHKQARWNEECDRALMAIKQYFTEPSILASLEADDTLYLYLAISKASISAVLFKEDKNQKQRLIFFVSKSLFEAETQYTCLEHAALAFRVVVKKLCPYFQAHLIVVLTNLPLRSTIHKLGFSGRIAR